MHRLARASEELKIDLWIKRDDLTGFAFGGNKGRKLEFLMAEALARNADTVVTCGAAQSNFIRQLGAACSMFGLRCVAVVMDLPYDVSPPTGIRLDPWVGNPGLDALVGVETILMPNGTWNVLFASTKQVALDLSAQGRRVYEIPIGGSSALGAFAFYRAASEVIDSGGCFDWVVTSSSSGSTQTGLTYGFRSVPTRVLGIAADPEPEFIDDLVKLGQALANLIGVPRLDKDAFKVELGYCGDGYGVTDEQTLEAIRWLSRIEGIFLDPIYSGKAFRGLMDLARTGLVSGTVLFWHTGGLPTLFALQNP
jgi:1-aminocyclopropane-1-carboxylate deaminase/D-cysteine desulfhydrase-like pyridoxal-dependent ACC family enzyme